MRLAKVGNGHRLYNEPLNPFTGTTIGPKVLYEIIRLQTGTFHSGIGGIHSPHGHNLLVMVGGSRLYSNFDVAPHYPKIIIRAGIAPNLE